MKKYDCPICGSALKATSLRTWDLGSPQPKTQPDDLAVICSWDECELHTWSLHQWPERLTEEQCRDMEYIVGRLRDGDLVRARQREELRRVWGHRARSADA